MLAAAFAVRGIRTMSVITRRAYRTYHLMIGKSKETPPARIVKLRSTEPKHMSDALHMGPTVSIGQEQSLTIMLAETQTRCYTGGRDTSKISSTTIVIRS